MAADRQQVLQRIVRLLVLVMSCGLSNANADDGEHADLTVLRVGSQNLLHDFPNYYQLRTRMSHVAEEIRDRELDVVGLQESARIDGVGLVPAEIARQLGYHYAYFDLELAGRPLGFENGIAIISRYPILGQNRLTFTHQKGMFEARAVIRALIQTPLGPSISTPPISVETPTASISKRPASWWPS